MKTGQFTLKGKVAIVAGERPAVADWYTTNAMSPPDP